MRLDRSWRIAALLLLAAAMAVPACTSNSTGEESGSGEEPVSVEYPDGGDLATITLTEDAARRLDVQTTAVVSAGGADSGLTVIPYSAVLYDPSGDTWTYTSPEPLIFVRAPIDVKRIEGQSAILVSGPPVGTEVVTVGESELLGSEYEVGGE
jgi:hypothetical protein